MFLSLQNFTLKIDPHAYLLVILSGQPRNTKTCKFYLFASLPLEYTSHLRSWNSMAQLLLLNQAKGQTLAISQGPK